mgnify:CR=1 FL=1
MVRCVVVKFFCVNWSAEDAFELAIRTPCPPRISSQPLSSDFENKWPKVNGCLSKFCEDRGVKNHMKQEA